MGKLASLFFLLSLLCFFLLSVQTNITDANFFPFPPPPNPTRIYITSDGNVEPSTVPIQRNGNVYTFIGNLHNFCIEVQRDNIVIDGAGFTIDRVETYTAYATIYHNNTGITLSSRSNVTIKNININQFGVGIKLNQSSNNHITANKILGSCGVTLDSSANNQIIGNSIINTKPGYGCGVQIISSSFNTIISNNFTDTKIGVQVANGDYNTISENIFIDQTSISLSNTEHNTISENHMMGGSRGIIIRGSNNTVFGNNIAGKSRVGISMSKGFNNTVYDNYVVVNMIGVVIGSESKITVTDSSFARFDNVLYEDDVSLSKYMGAGYFSGDFEHTVDTLLDERTGTFWARVHIWSLWNTTSSTITECKAEGDGISVFQYQDDGCTRLYIREFYGGIEYSEWVDISQDVTYYLTIGRSGSNFLCKIYTDAERTSIYDTLFLSLHAVYSYDVIYAVQSVGTASENSGLHGWVRNLKIEEIPLSEDFTTYTEGEVKNNTFYCNNIVNNIQNVFTGNPRHLNFWDNGKEGNYWSDHKGTDDNGDGIGDTPYVIDENNQDNYPLMSPADVATIPEFPSWIILPLFFVASLVGVTIKRKVFRPT